MKDTWAAELKLLDGSTPWTSDGNNLVDRFGVIQATVPFGTTDAITIAFILRAINERSKDKVRS
jgi:hypothetical protein